MSNPFAVQPGGVIQDPGTGGAIASSIAQVLAAQQQQKENEYRMQQLAQQQAQQQALAQYYQAQTANQQQQTDLDRQKFQMQRAGQQQVGGAIRGALGGQPSMQTQPADTSSPLHQALQGGAQAIGGQQGYANIFGGVADENMGAAVQGVQDVQKILPQPEKPMDPGTDPKKWEYYQHLVQTDPVQAAEFKKAFIDKTPAVQVNVGNKAETAYATEDAKNQATVTAKSEDAARQAIQSMPAITEAYKVLGDGKAFLGLGAKQKLFAGRVAAALGVPDADIRVSDTQTLWRLTGETTLSYLRSRDLGSGTAVSNSDRDYMAALSGQDLSQQPLALRKIMRINFGALVYKQSEAIGELRQQALDNPDRASSLNRRAARIQKQYESGWRQYAGMLKAEGVAENDIMGRMVNSGIQDPDAIMKGLPAVNIQKLGDTVFGGPNGQ